MTVPTEPALDTVALSREAAALTAKAESLGATYRRRTWLRFVAVFFPVPFVVVLLRLELDAWHYFLAGVAYIAFSAALYVIDSRASAHCDAAAKAAEQAQAALAQAHAGS